MAEDMDAWARSPGGERHAEAPRLIARLRDCPSLSDAWLDVRLPRGAHLFREGDEGDAFYTIVTGRLEVYQTGAEQRRLVLARVGPGASLGELALLDGGVRSASVVSLTDCRLHGLRRDDFLASLSTCPELSELTISLLGDRMRRNTEHVQRLTRWARLLAAGDYEAARRDILRVVNGREDTDSARFALTFIDMVDAVRAREERLQRELRRLRIEIDESRRAAQVAEITEDEFFRSLQRSAEELRGRLHAGTTGDPGARAEDDAAS